MIDMKLSDEEQKEYGGTAMAPKPLYPYGLSINLDHGAMEKLGLGLPRVGDVIEFKCRAQVTSASEYASLNDPECSCGLQITNMEVSRELDPDKAAQRLYGEK